MHFPSSDHSPLAASHRHNEAANGGRGLYKANNKLLCWPGLRCAELSFNYPDPAPRSPAFNIEILLSCKLLCLSQVFVAFSILRIRGVSAVRQVQIAAEAYTLAYVTIFTYFSHGLLYLGNTWHLVDCFYRDDNTAK